MGFDLFDHHLETSFGIQTIIGKWVLCTELLEELQFFYDFYLYFSPSMMQKINLQSISCTRPLKVLKGELFSKVIFVLFFNSPKKRMKTFCPRGLGQKLTFSSSFFGTLKFPFEINWPL